MNQAVEHWSAFEREFYRDGSLRDLYVLNSTLEDWNAAARFLGREYPLHFTGGWNGTLFPPDLATLFPRTETDLISTLAVDCGGVSLCSHFFSEDEVEFDLCPEEVTSGDRLDAVFRFMRGLAAATGKDVILTPENMREIVIFRVNPGADIAIHVPFGGFTEVV